MHFNVGPSTSVRHPIILPRYPTVNYNAPVVQPLALGCASCGPMHQVQGAQINGVLGASSPIVPMAVILIGVGGLLAWSIVSSIKDKRKFR